MPVPTSTMIRTHSSTSNSAEESKALKSSIALKLSSTELKVKRNRSLDKIYHRAARAFLNKNVALTQELLDTGFKSLQDMNFDASAARKWDILRITFDTMLYTSPPSSTDPQTRQISSLNSLLSKTPQEFVKDMYNRSLELLASNGAATVLPSQVLSTLVYSSLKADAADVGRWMIEDWLASRGSAAELSSSWMSASSASTETPLSDGYDADGSMNGDSPKDGLDIGDGHDGYSKVLELYCLQVLPKLEQWDYATEFLEYESELSPEVRHNIQHSLHSLYAQAIASRLPSSSTRSPSGMSSSSSTPPPSAKQRAFSPAPSTSSSSSSLSTTSTHTVVPTTPRARPHIEGITSSTNGISEEGSADGSDGTITPRQRANARPHHRRIDSKSKGKQRAKTPLASSPPSSSVNAHPLNPNALTPLSLPKTHLNSSPPRRQTPNTLALIKASIEPYVTQITSASSANKLTSLMVIFVVIPVFSLLVRMLRRRPRLSGTSEFGATSAVLVRQRLQSVNTSYSAMGALGQMFMKAWGEIIRVVLDTVKMGGSGLV
ncbi:hypothetical protein F5878DRAFT_605906 [Lentinula raphanica]|uniref:Uncharacterized protein n=1 Tax=Lentinula raphanica TaxID=153919 RepID=A0AA38PHJ6_9AGAR|nr:hypothetical protein F5880DRAFT_1562381 [Lentinula raphanica]KAJ3843068.1 hypothetical protein F5878DRAFT_605906 [Lentinula raphanica]